MSIRKFIKFVLTKLLAIFGFYLSKTRTCMDDVLSNMVALGYKPTTIIDVGVANGTEDLYEVFPDARYLLIEPLEEFKIYLDDICSKYDAEYVIAAASNVPGSISINVHPDLCGSSLLKEVEGEEVDGVSRDIDAITIDQECEKRGLKGSFVIKIDVQGGEIKVLDGALITLQNTEVVILEVSLFGFFVGGPQFYDIVAYMKDKGFVVYDIFDGRNRPIDNALAQVDIAFVKEDGQFRVENSYCTEAQRKSLNKTNISRVTTKTVK